MDYTKYILYTIVLLILVYFLYNLSFKRPKKKIDVVIARYAESLEWLYHPDILSYLQNNEYIDTRIIVYNKGPDIPLHLNNYNNINIEIINLPNVGRCDHMYLYHIISNYDNLADITLFLPGCADMKLKIERLLFCFEKTYTTLNSVFIADKENLNSLYNFHMDSWLSSDKVNRKHINNSMMLKSNIRPFGKWYEKVYGNKEITHSVYYGIFSVSNKHIKNSSLEFYKELISYVDTHYNPEVGHYLERTWIVNFQPVEDSCYYYGFVTWK